MQKPSVERFERVAKKNMRLRQIDVYGMENADAAVTVAEAYMDEMSRFHKSRAGLRGRVKVLSRARRDERMKARAAYQTWLVKARKQLAKKGMPETLAAFVVSGHEAGRVGQLADTNPHPEDTAEAQAWELGRQRGAGRAPVVADDPEAPC